MPCLSDGELSYLLMTQRILAGNLSKHAQRNAGRNVNQCPATFLFGMFVFRVDYLYTPSAETPVLTCGHDTA